jgi:hypothetical protein
MPRKMTVTLQDGSSPILTEGIADNEKQLQAMVKNNVDLIPVEEFGMTGPLMTIGRETNLASGAVDLVAFTMGGDILVIEFKTGPQNSDFRAALGRSDLGRLAEESAADLLVINLQGISYGPMRDPVTALVDYGTGKDVETVIVAGEIVIENGTSSRMDEADIYARAQAAATSGWDDWAARDWANRDVETITPPAFPTRSTGK